MKILWIALGGALGTLARYQLDGWTQGKLGTAFPFGTLAVNLIGSFLMAGLMHIGLRTEAVPAVVRVALTTGLLGGFTTYSTFNYESQRYIQDGAWPMALANIAVTVLGCLAAGLAGSFVARSLVGP
jgi:CrcB protein